MLKKLLRPFQTIKQVHTLNILAIIRSYGDVPVPTPQVTIRNLEENAKMASAYLEQQNKFLDYVKKLSNSTPKIPSNCISTIEVGDVTNIVSLENYTNTQNTNKIASAHYKKGEVSIWQLREQNKILKKFATGSYRMEYGWHISKFFDQELLLCSYPYAGFKVINHQTGVLESNIEAIEPAPLNEAAKHAMLGFGTHFVVIGCRNGSVSFYNRSTKEPLKIVNDLHTNYVRCLQFTQKQGILATGGLDGLLRLIDIESGEAKKTLQGHEHWISSIAIMDASKLVTSSGDKTIRVWNIESGECVQVLTGHAGRINQVIPLGGGIIASCSDDKYIKIWNATDGTCIVTLKGHEDHVKNLVFLSDGRLISSSLDGTIKIWQ